MKKWQNPEVQALFLEKTERGSIKEVHCEACQQQVMFLVGEMICYYCECCGEEFHSNKYGSQDQAKAAAEAHEATCEQCRS